MGRVGPTTASSTPEILTTQYFRNQISIYTPTAAYATYRYGTSPNQGGCLSVRGWEKYPLMLYKAIRFSEKLEQPHLLGGREGILDYCGPAHKCSEGWDASREYLFHGGCDDIEHTSYPNPETTRGTILVSRLEPHILPGRRGKTEARKQWPLRSPPLPEDVTTTGAAPEAGQAEGIAATDPHVAKERRKRGNDGVDTNAPPKVRRRDHIDPRQTKSAPVDVNDPDPLSFADPQSHPSADVAQSSKGAAAARDLESENTSFTSMLGSPESIYRPEWGIMNGCLLDAPEACQDLVDHIALPGYFLKFEQETKLLKKPVAQVARRDKRIQARENEIKNLETLLEAEADIKKAGEGKNAELTKELENMRALFFDLHVSNNHRSQQVSTLQAQVMGEENLKAAFEDFNDRRSQVGDRAGVAPDSDEVRCATELRQAFADVVSIGIGQGMSEVLKHGVEHGKANLSLEAIEAFDPEAEAKYITALHALKDLKYPIVDQLESLKDAPIDVIMASLHLEIDTRDDAPQWIRELCPSSSQLTIPVYPETRDPTDHWACKEEILLADAIAANVSRVEKKKKCRVVWRTHGSALRITPCLMVCQYPCQALLHKVSLSCWRIRLHRLKYLRTGPLPAFFRLSSLHN
nr:hypothetical protein [Tanacetum cinerariifolium]